MASFNKVILIGNLVADPELKQTPSGVAVTSFRIAVGRKYRSGGEAQPQADFIDIVAWRNTAEFVSRYFTKGRMAVVEGRLQMRDWTDKEGNKRRSAEVVADNVYFGDSRRDEQPGSSSFGGNAYGGNSYGGGYGAPAPAGGFGGYAAPSGAPASDFAMLDDDDAQLPF